MNDHGIFLALGILAALVACGLAWIAALLRVRAGHPLLEHEPRRDVPWGLVDLLIAVVVLMGTQLFALRVVSNMYGINLGPDLANLSPEQHGALIVAGAVSTLVTVVASLILVMLHTGARVHEFGFDVRRWWHDVWRGVAAFVMLGPLVYLIQFALVQWFESKHPLIELLKANPDPYLFAVITISAVVVAPIAEEYLFRVLLQGWLEKLATFRGGVMEILFGGSTDTSATTGVAPHAGTDEKRPTATDDRTDDNPYASPSSMSHQPNQPDAMGEVTGGWRESVPLWPILISAILFAGMHASHGPDPIPLFVLAVGLGFLYQRTHRIVPCIVLHALLNGCSMLLLWIDIYFARL